MGGTAQVSFALLVSDYPDPHNINPHHSNGSFITYAIYIRYSTEIVMSVKVVVYHLSVNHYWKVVRCWEIKEIMKNPTRLSSFIKLNDMFFWKIVQTVQLLWCGASLHCCVRCLTYFRLVWILSVFPISYLPIHFRHQTNWACSSKENLPISIFYPI